MHYSVGSRFNSSHRHCAGHAGRGSIRTSGVRPLLKLLGLALRLHILGEQYRGHALAKHALDHVGLAQGGVVAQVACGEIVGFISADITLDDIQEAGEYPIHHLHLHLHLSGDGTGSLFAGGGLLGTLEGEFEVTYVPLPAAAWLFLSAIGGVGIIKRK
jgi:hypothetical protein